MDLDALVSGERRLGRFSIVGTTIQDPHLLPRYFMADEKHTKHNGQRVYSARTIANGRVPGAAVKASAAEEDMEKA